MTSRRPVLSVSFQTQLTLSEDFDLNKVDGHSEYTYIELFERIEKVMAEKNKLNDEEEKQTRGEDPKTRHLGSTKTTWVNFLDICEAINREPQHILDFLKAELDVEGKGDFGKVSLMIVSVSGVI